MYDPKSLKAEEFINDEEILESLKYADDNKNNVELIDAILEKARERKGLSHRDASVLLACDIPEKNEEIYALAEQGGNMTSFQFDYLSLLLAYQGPLHVRKHV